MINTAKILALFFIFMSLSVQAQQIEEQEVNKFVTDYLSKRFIIVKPINTNDNKITYEAIVAGKKCNVIVTVNPTQEETKLLIEKLDCSN